ncbi:MAG: nuclear transport factor 2 family protein [Spongiibacteraceae bacterium]
MAIDFEQALQAYFGYINARDVKNVAAMYAPDGELILHTGQHVTGRAALSEFFQTLFLQSPPAPRVVNIVGAGRQCAAELRVTLPGNGETSVADFFKFDDDGLITSLTIYATESVRT